MQELQIPFLQQIQGFQALILAEWIIQRWKILGETRILKNLLKNLQPKAFTGEGNNISKILKEWIMSMDDYFALAGCNAVAQGIMGRAKLEGLAKFWWKLHCQTQGKLEITMGWGELKESLKE